MTKSTARTGLARASAIVFALGLALGWSESGPVLAHSTAEVGGGAPGAPLLADPRFEAPESSSSTLDLQARRKDVRAFGILDVKPTTEARPVKAKPATIKTSKPASQSQPTYAGYNRFWIPSLGMNYKVRLFECSRSRPPDNYMYRWGCAGANNTYILGHAYSVMKPLHDLYVAGRLRKGLVAIYADGNGRVHWFRVTEWRVVDPVESAWAIADQPVPSMTLQTCVGKDGRYRLNVRLVQFKVT